MGIGDWESNGTVKQASRRRKERLKKNHGSDRGRSKDWVPIIERFGAAAHGTGKETLVVPRCFTEDAKPFGEAAQNFRYSFREFFGYACGVH